MYLSRKKKTFWEYTLQTLFNKPTKVMTGQIFWNTVEQEFHYTFWIIINVGLSCHQC